MSFQANGQYIYCAVSKVETIQECVIRDYRVYITVVVASERVQRPSEHASSDIFNTDYLWEYGPKVMGKPRNT